LPRLSGREPFILDLLFYFKFQKLPPPTPNNILALDLEKISDLILSQFLKGFMFDIKVERFCAAKE
jgi:hypothetical protein